MEENPYRAPREKGTALRVGRCRIPERIKRAVGAAVVNIVFCSGWMGCQASKPAGLSWAQAKTPTLMIVAVLFALAVTVWQTPPDGAVEPGGQQCT